MAISRKGRFTCVREYPKYLPDGGSLSQNLSYTDVISSEGIAEAEKSPAVETARCVPAPAHLPAVAHRRLH